MEISYKRELKHNYMIIKAEPALADHYEVRMLYGNPMEGVLRFRTKQTDGELFFYYEITSRQPLSRLLENRCIQKDEISQILLQTAHILRCLEAFLIPEARIVLDADYIYIDPDSFQLSFCLVPGRDGKFPEDMSRLLQFILKRVDHQDQGSVVLAYGVYQESLKDNYGMEDLLKLLKPGRLNPAEDEGTGVPRPEIPGSGVSRLEMPGSGVLGPGNSGAKVSASGAALGSGISKSPGTPNIGPLFTGHPSQEDSDPWDFVSIREEREGGIRDDSKRHQGKNRGQGRRGSWRLTAGIGICMILLPAAVWFLQGESGLYRGRVWLAAVEGGLALSLMAAAVFNLRERSPAGKRTDAAVDSLKGPGRQESEWQMLFAEDVPEPEPVKQQMASPDEPRTMLLAQNAGQGGEAVCRLTSMDKRTEDITIPYFPFIIGKQQGITDYVLGFDTVSRLHARIDKQEGEYQITDLNSTNGTKVRGKILENNETVPLYTGNEVYIADFGFVFL